MAPKPHPQRRAADQSSVGRAVMEHPEGLNWTTLASVATVLGVIGGLVVWVFGFLATKSDFVAHVQHDNGVQQWNQYGLAQNRAEYLDDRTAECEFKRAVTPKLKPDETAICARYEAKLKQKQAEAAELKAKAVESTKEKP